MIGKKLRDIYHLGKKYVAESGGLAGLGKKAYKFTQETALPTAKFLFPEEYGKMEDIVRAYRESGSVEEATAYAEQLAEMSGLNPLIVKTGLMLASKVLPKKLTEKKEVDWD